MQITTNMQCLYRGQQYEQTIRAMEAMSIVPKTWR